MHRPHVTVLHKGDPRKRPPAAGLQTRNVSQSRRRRGGQRVAGEHVARRDEGHDGATEKILKNRLGSREVVEVYLGGEPFVELPVRGTVAREETWTEAASVEHAMRV